MKVSAAGGTPEELIWSEKGKDAHYLPQLLPGGHHVLFVSGGSGRLSSEETSRIEIVEVETGHRKVIHEGGLHPRYSTSGHLLFVDRGTLFAALFDSEKLEMTSEPVPVLRDVRQDNFGWGAAHYDLSANGTLLYLREAASQGRYLVEWMDREGKREPLLSVPNDYRHVRFSPDGRRLAVEIHDGTQSDIWVHEWERDRLSRLTFDAANDGLPVWSPDSIGLVFRSERDGHGIYWRRSDGSGEAVRLTESKGYRPYSWHPSGKYLAFNHWSATSGDIGILPLEGDSQSGWEVGEPTDFLKTPHNELVPAFSPDGEWLAYISDESGRNEIYVRPFPGPGGKWQISNGGGIIPAWFSNNRELLYQRGEGQVSGGAGTLGPQQFMVVPYTVEGESFRPGTPRLWTEEALPLRRFIRNYDPDPDAKRIAVFRAAQDQVEESPNNAILILNFFEVLRQELADR